MAVEDNKGIVPEREASIAEIHAQFPFDSRIAVIAEIEYSLSQRQGSLTTQRSLAN